MKIVFATSNKNKIKEVQRMLPSSIQILSLEDINCFEEIPETSDTIEGNALQKANYVLDNYNVPCFADDTGLKVSSLNGEPGVYSARYSGPEKNDKNNIDKLLNELNNKSDRSAHFKTVVAIAGLSTEPTICKGICNGDIISECKGENGFGYDPIFQPEGYEVTFAEMELEEKNKISHRGLAIKELINYLSSL